jgi:diguanylate cyclase (GGDEF)-like protein
LAGAKSDSVCPAGARKCTFLDEIIQLKERCHQLETLSQVDALTGLYNFRYLMKALEMEMERTRRSRLPTGLVMIDLDHFRRVNNDYGHQIGNLALCWVGKVWKDNVRLIDIPCRYGGEEFTLILPSTSLAQSIEIADRLRRAIKAYPLELDQGDLPITASFGVAVFRHTDGLSPDEFIAKADQYLLQAKLGGRDRVCAQEAEPSVEDGVSPEEKSELFRMNQD